MESYDEWFLKDFPGEARDVAEVYWPTPRQETPGDETSFTVEEYPQPLRDYVTALAESTQTSPKMAGVLALGVLATAAQSKYTVQVTPDWREPLCLFTLAVAEPGERKSAVLSALLEPVREYEREARELEAAEVACSAGMKAALEKALQLRQRDLANRTPGTPEYTEGVKQLRSAAEELAGFREKSPTRLLVDDATPEKLVDLMAAQGGCITLASAEGGIFDYISTGRYDSAGSLDVYLKGHAGDEIVVDRIGRGVNLVREPRLTVMLTIQPNVLRNIMKKRELRGRGLTARFLYALCPSRLGSRKADPEPIPEEVKQSYRALIRFLLSSPWRGTITLSPEAQEVRLLLQNRVEAYLNGSWLNMRDWAGKLVGSAVRIAGLLHICETRGDPTQIPISESTMARAACIAYTLADEAELVYDVRKMSASDRDALYVAGILMNKGIPCISRRDLYRKCAHRFENMRAFNEALGRLEDMDYIRGATVRQFGARDMRFVIANPKIFPEGTFV